MAHPTIDATTAAFIAACVGMLSLVNIGVNVYNIRNDLRGAWHTIHNIATNTEASVLHPWGRFEVRKDGATVLSVDPINGTRLLSPYNLVRDQHGLRLCPVNCTGPCITLRAPGNLSAGTAYTLPETPPTTEGNVLFTGPDGVMYWGDPVSVYGTGETADVIFTGDLQVLTVFIGDPETSVVYIDTAPDGFSMMNISVSTDTPNPGDHLVWTSDYTLEWRPPINISYTECDIVLVEPTVMQPVNCTLTRRLRLVNLVCNDGITFVLGSSAGHYPDVGTIPVGFRPLNYTVYIPVSDGEPQTLHVHANGSVHLHAGIHEQYDDWPASPFSAFWVTTL